MTNIFQNKIRKIMTERKLPQTKLAEMIGVRQSQISNWLNGKSLPNYESLAALSDKLEISVAEFFK
jgi:transcriptional regulator with XRE-family HTH domain